MKGRIFEFLNQLLGVHISPDAEHVCMIAAILSPDSCDDRTGLAGRGSALRLHCAKQSSPADFHPVIQIA